MILNETQRRGKAALGFLLILRQLLCFTFLRPVIAADLLPAAALLHSSDHALCPDRHA